MYVIFCITFIFMYVNYTPTFKNIPRQYGVYFTIYL